jgi:LAS superfamily LD-carboxypeptidase LdcB
MHAAALKDGIRLNILSATRNFQHQKWLWLDKWTGRSRVDGINLVKKFPKPMDRAREILRYSSMPGTSRHHWGTDMDLNNLYDDYFTQGKGKKVFNWLIKNAPSYGFCMPYSALGKSRTYGYEEEKWHWSFQPLSSQLLAAYLKKISVKDIRGFKGDLVVEKLNVIQIYVQSVDPLCR